MQISATRVLAGLVGLGEQLYLVARRRFEARENIGEFARRVRAGEHPRCRASPVKGRATARTCGAGSGARHRAASRIASRAGAERIHGLAMMEFH